MFPRADMQLSQLDAVRYAASSGERYLSAKVSITKNEQRTYTPIDSDTLNDTLKDTLKTQKMTCGDGAYADNNGLFHFCMHNPVPDYPIIVAHMIEPSHVEMRNNEPANMQEKMIASYCAQTRDASTLNLTPTIFDTYEIRETVKHDLYGRINLHVTVVDMKPVTEGGPSNDAADNIPPTRKLTRIVFVGFVRESKTLPMLPSHVDKCKKHKDFAAESYDALKSSHVEKVLLEHSQNGCFVCVAGGGMKMFTAGVTILEMLSEFCGSMHAICGVSGGSWAMMYHASEFARASRGRARVHALIDMVEKRWDDVVLNRSVDDDADKDEQTRLTKLSDLLSKIHETTGVLTKDQTNYIKEIIHRVGKQFKCDWHEFVSTWLFGQVSVEYPEWTLQEAYGKKMLIFGCTMFEQGALPETVARDALSSFTVGATRTAARLAGNFASKRPRLAMAAATPMLPVVACNYVAARRFASQSPLPSAPISFAFHDGKLIVCDFKTYDVSATELTVAQPVSMPSASAISSAAAAGLASRELIKVLLNKVMLFGTDVAVRTLQEGALPFSYPKLMLSVVVAETRNCHDKVDAEDDGDQETASKRVRS